MTKRMDIEERFALYVEITPTCWLWTGGRRDNGYAQFSYHNVSILAHRWVYQRYVEPIPIGRDLDHTCHTKHCVNLDHLRVVTCKQNGENRLGVPSNNTSGYQGVCWFEQKGKWWVRVTHNGKMHHGGYFADVHEAGEAARQLRNELYTYNDLDRGERL